MAKPAYGYIVVCLDDQEEADTIYTMATHTIFVEHAIAIKFAATIAQSLRPLVVSVDRLFQLTAAAIPDKPKSDMR